MVPLEDRISFATRISQTDKLAALHALINKHQFNTPDVLDATETNRIYFQSIKAILASDKKLFSEGYAQKSKSNPTSESLSPFIYDDFLIFTFIVGVKHFEINYEWLDRILTLRNDSSISITFRNILSNDYHNSANLSEVTICFLNLINPTEISNDLLVNTYLKVVNDDDIFEGRSDFLKICSMFSFDTAIKNKQPIDTTELGRLRNFSNTFLKKANTVSYILLYLLLTVFALLFQMGASRFPQIKSTLENFGHFITLCGFLGLSLLDGPREWMKNWVCKWFGYRT